MDDNTEVDLKNICCTCLSRDRKLFKLCRLNDGVNNLYLLLSYDSEAYREGFFKDTVSLYICWECQAVMHRISLFRRQACVAQRLLSDITDGRTDIKYQKCLSNLSTHHITDYNSIIEETDTMADNFIDCGPDIDIKSETEEDIPLSELHNNWPIDNETDSKKVKTKKVKLKLKKIKTHFSTEVLNEDELKEVRLHMKLAPVFVDSIFKCDSCVEVFENEITLQEHNSLHVEILDHRQCDICLAYINESLYPDHRSNHYQRHNCTACEFYTCNINEMERHLADIHGVKDVKVLGKRKKGIKKSKKTVSSTEHDDLTTDRKKTQLGYLCKECNKYFDNKKQRWNHVQRFHKEGYKCTTCEKRFPFKNNLTRHEQVHVPPPRSQCPVCHKSVREHSLKAHARIHTYRETRECRQCCKTFVSKASYEHHLKYTQAHAVIDILKYKCSSCDKGYRSQGELRDHVNYQHMGKTQHKCPICGKALATRRCITRHVRRAHDGIKESVRDKICQQCGKAFRDKKSLREHELIHSGERPLSCELCGRTFRQSASLYSHRKRLHRVYPQHKTVVCVQ